MADTRKIIEFGAVASRLGVSRREQGVVSPCSVCRAYLKDPETGITCPRRHWIERAKSGEPVHPLLSRKNSYDLHQRLYKVQPAPDALENPVFSTEMQSVVVWVAALGDNPAVADPKTGKLLAPDLGLVAGGQEAAGYPTEYIRCRPYPFIPGQPGRLFTDLLFREWEPVVLETVVLESRQPGEEAPPVAGYVQRSGFVFHQTVQPASKSVNPSGF